MTKKIIKVDNMANFEFWLGMYKPRSKTWQRQRLRELKNGRNTLNETPSEIGDKIKALIFLLGVN